MHSEQSGSRLPPAVVAVCILASTGALSAAFPPAGVRWLAWVALVPLLLVLQGATPARAAGVGLLWSGMYACAVAHWLPSAIAHYYAQPYWVGFGFFAGAVLLTATLEIVAFCVVYARLTRRRGGAPPGWTAAAWVAAELARSRFLTGDPWGLIGYTQSATSIGTDALLSPDWIASRVVQVADFGSVYAVGFAIVFVNAAVVSLCLAMRGRRDPRRATAHGLQAIALAVAVLLYGQMRIAALPADGPRVAVAVVQGNLDLGARWDPALYGTHLREYLKLTQQVLATDAFSIVIWPENAMTFFAEEEPDYRKAIARVLGPHDVQLLAGGPRFEAKPEERQLNSALLFSPQGEILGAYDKRHLLPFAEYFPYPSMDAMRRSFGRVREFRPGGAGAPLKTAAGTVAVSICNETMFPRVVRTGAAGADLLVSLANDGWLGSRGFSENQLQMSAMRAVEHRRWLVRSSTTGPSALIDPLGRVAVRSEPFEAAVLTGRVTPRTEQTFYAAYGDVFGFACAAAVLSLVVPMVLPERRVV